MANFNHPKVIHLWTVGLSDGIDPPLHSWEKHLADPNCKDRPPPRQLNGSTIIYGETHPFFRDTPRTVLFIHVSFQICQVHSKWLCVIPNRIVNVFWLFQRISPRFVVICLFLLIYFLLCVFFVLYYDYYCCLIVFELVRICWIFWNYFGCLKVFVLFRVCFVFKFCFFCLFDYFLIFWVCFGICGLFVFWCLSYSLVLWVFVQNCWFLLKW